MTSTEQPPTGVAPSDANDVDAAWRAHGPAALRFATVLLGPDDAHDITVTAFLRVTTTPNWRVVQHRRAYLLRAVSNAAHDHRRLRERRGKRDIAAVLADSTTSPEPQVDLRRQIAKLSIEQRAAVFLTYWEDMTEAAIAELLGVSTGTVHRNLTRARFQLRKALHE